MSAQLVWLVTGCSSGFGAEFIKAILARGDRAIATARNPDALKQLADAGAAALQLDVSAPLTKFKEKVAEAVRIYGRVDVVVANAGYAQFGAIEELEMDNLVKQFQTNTFGTLNLIQAIMPRWREQKAGYLVVNSSMMARWQTSPGWGGYAASKAALNALIAAFAVETAELGFIQTLIIEPGMFRTSVSAAEKTADFAKPSLHYQALHDFYREIVPMQLHGKQPGDPKKVAKLVVDIVKGTDVAEAKEVPIWLPLGSDAFSEAKKHNEKSQEVLGEWEAVIRSTDFPAESGASASLLDHLG